MKRLMNLLMLSCKKASELIDKQSLIKLSLKEILMLRMHTGMCDACASYQKQSKLLDELLSNQISSITETQIPALTNNQLKQQIIQNLNNNK